MGASTRKWCARSWHSIETPSGDLILEVFEDGVPPRFRLRGENGTGLLTSTTSVETVRPDGTRLVPTMGFAWYANIDDGDLGAVVAYLRTLQ